MNGPSSDYPNDPKGLGRWLEPGLLLGNLVGDQLLVIYFRVSVHGAEGKKANGQGFQSAIRGPTAQGIFT